MSVAGSEGRRAGLAGAKRAWARGSGGSGPRSPPPRRTQAAREAALVDPRALPSDAARGAASGHGDPAAVIPPGPACPESLGQEGAPQNEEASPAGPRPCPLSARRDAPPPPLNAEFPVPAPTLFAARGEGSPAAVPPRVSPAPLFLAGAPLALRRGWSLAGLRLLTPGFRRQRWHLPGAAPLPRQQGSGRRLPVGKPSASPSGGRGFRLRRGLGVAGTWFTGLALCCRSRRPFASFRPFSELVFG